MKKLSELAKSKIRLSLWVASIVWTVFVLTLLMVVLPVWVQLVKKVWIWITGSQIWWFPLGVFSVTYVIVGIASVVIFIWFFKSLYEKRSIIASPPVKREQILKSSEVGAVHRLTGADTESNLQLIRRYQKWYLSRHKEDPRTNGRQSKERWNQP